MACNVKNFEQTYQPMFGLGHHRLSYRSKCYADKEYCYPDPLRKSGLESQIFHLYEILFRINTHIEQKSEMP